MKKTIKNAMSSLTAKFAALLFAFTCAGSAWGATTVATEAELRAAIANGGAVTLGADIALTQGEIAVSNTVTLDLATFTISSPTNVFRVAANGNFTVNADATAPGGIYTTATNACVYTAYGLNPGPKTIVINGGVFDGNCVFNFSDVAAANIKQRYGIDVAGAGSGEKADPTSVTINGGTFQGGYSLGNVGAYRCYYFTVNGGTFERGLDCADTEYCSIGVTTTCKAYFTGGKYRDRYPAARRRNHAPDTGKVFIGSNTHTNVYYIEGDYYVIAYDYSECDGTASFTKNKVRDASWLSCLFYDIHQEWYEDTDVWHYKGTAPTGTSQTHGDLQAASPIQPVIPAIENVSVSARPAVRLLSASPAKQLLSSSETLGEIKVVNVADDGYFTQGPGAASFASSTLKEKLDLGTIDVCRVFEVANSIWITSSDAGETGSGDDDATLYSQIYKKVSDAMGGYGDYDLVSLPYTEAEKNLLLKYADQLEAKGREMEAKNFVSDGNGSYTADLIVPLCVASHETINAESASDPFESDAQLNWNMSVLVSFDTAVESGSVLVWNSYGADTLYGEGIPLNSGNSFSLSLDATKLSYLRGSKQASPWASRPLLVALQNKAAENVGKTVTVTLRLVNPDNSSDYRDRASFSYTFTAETLSIIPKVVFESIPASPTAAEIEKLAIDQNGDKIVNGSGSLPESKFSSLANNSVAKSSNTDTGLASVELAEESNEATTATKYLSIAFKQMRLNTASSGCDVLALSYNVKPMAKIVSGNTDTTRTITDTEIGGKTITFRLPLTDEYTERALVVHTSDDATYPEERRIANVEGSAGARYVEISTTHFSEFVVSPIGDADIVYVTSAAGAFIGGYTTLADAYAATEDGGTIYLLQNVSEGIEVSTAKTFNINANGYAYSGAVTAASGLVLSATTSGTTTTYAAAVAIARIGSTEYGSLETLLAAIPSDGTPTTITILVDLPTGNTYITLPQGYNVTIDFNGHVITSTLSGAYAPIENYGTLTLVDTSAGKTGGIAGVNRCVNNYGTLNVGTGTFDSGTKTASNVVFGGNYTTTSHSGGTAIRGANASAVMNIWDCNVNAGMYAVYNYGTANVYGGTFNGTSCSKCTDSSWAYTFSSAGTLNFYNGAVSGVHGALSVVNGTASIYDGTFTVVSCQRLVGHSETPNAGNYYALYVAGETGAVSCDVLGGTFTSPGGSVVLNGNSGDGGLKEHASLAIHGGTFVATGSSTTVFQNDNVLGDPKIYAGTFTAATAEKIAAFYESATSKGYLGDDYRLSELDAATHTYTVESRGVAKIERTGEATQYYSTLAAAFGAAQTDDTILLLADVVLSSQINTFHGKSITLDLNGFTISGSGIAGATAIFTVGKQSTFIIEDSRGDGKICDAARIVTLGANNAHVGKVIVKSGSIESKGTGANDGGITTTAPGAEIEIIGGKVYGVKYGINVRATSAGGTGYVRVVDGTVMAGNGTGASCQAIHSTRPVQIEGGKIIANGTNQDYGLYVIHNGTTTDNDVVRITGGSISSSGGICAALSINSSFTVAISGGWFAEKVTASSATAVPDEYCAEDYVPSEETKNDFDDGLTYHTVKLGVAKIGTKAYDSLAEAFAAAEDGETVKLLKDVELTDRLFVNAGATPAYAGSNNRYATTSENKAVTLDLNGKNITSDSNIALAGGSLTITGKGTISTTGSGLAPIEVRGTGDLASKRTLTIGEDVTLDSTSRSYGLNVFGSNDAQKNIIDVTVNGTVNGTIFVLGNLKNAENEINIVVNGTVAAPAGEGDNVNVGIALNGNANVTVNNGATVSGDSGVEVRAGALTVNGGTITGTAETYSYKANGSGSTTKGAAISVAQHTTVLPTAVTLNGGTLVGTEKVYVKEVNAGMPDVTVQATQGYTATATIPEDFKWVETATAGVYTLAAKDYVAQIVRNDTVVGKYESLADAIAQAQADDTIALLADVNSDTRFSITKSLTIDGQGHTIAVNNHDNRVIDISETSDVTLTLKNVTIDGDNVKVDDAYPRGISMYGNTNVKLVLDNATVSAGHYAINVAGANNGVKIDIKNSSVASGWAAINVWSPAEINVTGSELSGSNDKGFEANGWNNFSTIVLNKQGDMSAAGSELTFTNTKIKSEVQTGNSQWFVDVRCGDATITFDNCEFEQTGTPADDGKHPDAMFAVRGAEVSDVTFDDCTFTKDGVEVDAVDALVQNTLFYSYPALYSDYVIDQTQYVIGTDGEVRQAVPGTVERDEDYNVTAGTFYDENDPTDTLADGYIADKNADGTYTVRVAHYVAQVFTGETAGQKYESLDEALKAAADGDTVKLLQDIELTDRLFVNAGTTPTLDSKNRYATTSENKSITLDLNGFDITSASNIALAGGSLTITGKGTISTTGSGLAPIEVRGTGDLASKRTLTIGEDVTLDSTSRSYGLNVFGSNDAQKNIIDVTVDGTVNGTVFVLGNLTNADNEINIVVNGTVVAPNNAAADKSNVGIAINGNANVTVNDGAAVSGDTGVEVRAGALTVNGGTITGTAETYSYKANGSGSTTKGAAVAVAQHTTRQPISVEVKGGTLAGPASVAVVDPENGDPAGVSVALKGGTFSGTVEIDESAASVGSIIPGEVGDGANPALFSDAASDGVAEDYKLVAVEPATDPVMYHVIPKDYVAQVGEGDGAKKYETLAEAVKAVPTDGTATTVKLLKDVSGETIAVNGNRNVVLDLDGKELTPDFLYVLNGALEARNGTIKNRVYVYGLDTDNSGMSSTFTLAQGATITAQYGVILNNMTTESPAYDATVNVAGTINGNIWVMGNIQEGDSVINVSGTVAASGVAIALNGVATLNVTGGTVTGTTGIEARAGTLNVTGGTIKETATGLTVKANGSGTTVTGAAVAISQHTTEKPVTVNISGGTLDATAGGVALYEVDTVASETPSAGVTATVTGGTFYGSVTNENGTITIPALVDGNPNPAHFSEQEKTQGVPADYKLVPVDGTSDPVMYQIVPKDYVAQVVREEAVVGKYESLAEAFAAAEDGDTVQLIADAELDDSLDVASDGAVITLDLNGKELSAAEGKVANDKFTANSAHDYLIGVKYGTTLQIVDSVGGGAIDGSKLIVAVKLTTKGETPANEDDSAALVVGSEDDANLNNFTISGDYYGISGNGTRHQTNLAVHGGTIQAVNDSEGTGIYQPQDGILYIGGGTIKGFDSAVEVRAGDATFWGGNYVVTGPTTYSATSNGNGTTIKGAAIAIDPHATGKELSVTVLDEGTYSFTVPQGGVRFAIANAENVDIDSLLSVQVTGLAEVFGQSFELPEGYDWYLVGEDVYTIKRTVAERLDANGGHVAYYATLEDAMDAVEDGETVKLLKDVELTDRLFVNAGATPAYAGSNNRYATTSENKAVTLDLNGKNITSDSNIALAGGSLNITGTGKISTTNDGLAPIEVRGTGDLANKRTLTIGSGVTLEGAEYGLNVFGSNDAQKNLIDVTVNGTVNGTIFVLGNLKNAENEINIVVNGTVTASAGSAEDVTVGIALNGNANVTVNDGAEVTGETGIEVRAGTLTVNGGKITGTASEYSYNPNGSGCTTKGAAVAVAQHGTKLATSVTLNGGTFEGVKTIGVTDVNGNMDNVEVLAKQGFTENSAIPDDYKWVETETSGVYELVPKDYVAQIGDDGEKFETLAEAFAAAQSGDTVKLLKDIELTDRLFVNAGATPAYAGKNNRYATTSENKAVTLDLNDHDITGSSNIALAGGSLTITGSGTISTTTSGLAPIEVRGTGSLTSKRTLTIDTGVTLEGKCYGVNVFGSNSADKNVIDVNVNGTVRGMVFVLGNLTNSANEININVTGTVDASAAVGEESVHTAIAQCGYSTVTVSDGAVVKGESGIETRAGTLTVDGGTITAMAAYNYASNGSGTTTKGAAVAVAQYGADRVTSVTINNGTLSGEKKIAVTDVNNDMSKVKVFAKEADTDPTVIPAGYSWAKSTEKPGMWTLVKQLASFTYPIEGTAGIPVDLQWLEDNLDGVTLPILETQTDDIIAALSKNGKNGIPVWQSYVLGLDSKSATSQLRLAATAKDATTVTITGIIDTTKFPKIANVTVTFRLASRNADGTWSNIDGCTGATSPSFDVALDAVAGKTLAMFADIVTE